jgi:glycerol-3-phosphate dehydrogenase
MPQTTQTIHLDIAVIGGGIAGLWLLNRLKNEGYNCSLFESKALGSDQSVASQGMIHGGIKYTLSGTLTGASEAIADMPIYWQNCLAGKGNVDLSQADVLSDHFYMWSSASAAAKLTTFFASKATRGRVDKVSATDRPAIFQNPEFKGRLYKLVDMVLDVPSVVSTLANNAQGNTFLLPTDQQNWQRSENGEVSLTFTSNNQHVEIKAKQFIFTAGKGNGELLNQLGAEKPAMQLRPLQQVIVKHDYPHPFYGHCLGTDKTPRLTISSHRTEDGKWAWYLGGSLSEKGASQSTEEVIQCAKDELGKLMPWVDLSKAEWMSLPIDRAEPKQKNLMRPDNAFVDSLNQCSNALVAWPTKLTLAPNLADATLSLLNKKEISPSASSSTALIAEHLIQAPIAKSPWDLFPKQTDTPSIA